MHRLADTPKPQGRIPESVALYADWQSLKSERTRFDRIIIDWADAVEPSWLAADMTYYSFATKSDWTRPRWMLVTHMFNHQTHHRGQVHSMLTQAGGRPGDTDLPFMPD